MPWKPSAGEDEAQGQSRSLKPWRLNWFSGEPSVLREVSNFGLVEYKPGDISRLSSGCGASSILGRGEFYELFEGRDDRREARFPRCRSSSTFPPTGANVIVKKLPESGRRRQAQAERMATAEIRALSHLAHRNILRMVGFCETSGGAKALVFEHASGGSLQDYFNKPVRERPPWLLRDRVQVALGLAEALSYVHSHGVIHRNLKPAAVLLTESLEAKLHAFHLHLSLEGRRDVEGMPPVRAQVCGTKGYMDPEQADSGTAHFRNDTYAFGVVLLQLVTGQGCFVQPRTGPSSLVGMRQTPAAGGAGALADWVWRMVQAGSLEGVADPVLWDSLGQRRERGPLRGNSLGRTGSRDSQDVDDPLRARNADEAALAACVHLGLACCLRDCRARPTMAGVALTLRDLKNGRLCPRAVAPIAVPFQESSLTHWL